MYIMEAKTHIFINNKIVKLSKYDTIMIFPNGTIEGYQEFDEHEETETLFRGTQEEAEHVMELIKEVLCINTKIPKING